MIEKLMAAVPPAPFTATGTPNGKATITSTRGFRVKQIVALNHPTLPSLELEVKRVNSKTQLELGPIGKIADRTDLSAYDTQAFIYANEQPKSAIPQGAVDLATYEPDPIVARRVFSVDELGNPYNTDNPLPVQLSNGSINIETLNAELRVQLSAKDNDPKAGDIHSSVRLGDGTNEIAVNTDGSLNVNVIQSSSVPGLQYWFNETLAVPNATETTLISLVGPPQGRRITKVSVSGDNLAQFRVKLDSNTVESRRTWWNHFNETFAFESFSNGLVVGSGVTLSVTVLQNRPVPGTYQVTVYAE